MGHCKVKCSYCSEQQVRWGVHWGLWQDWIGGLCGGFSFAGLWRFAAEEAALVNQSAESPIGSGTASSGYAMGHCKTKRSLCSDQQVW